MLDIMNNCRYTKLIGRALLGWIFFYGGLRLIGLNGGMGAGEAMGPIDWGAGKGIPAILVYLAFAVKLLGGLAVIVGFQTRLAALALAVFTLLTAFIFHFPIDPHFWKEISMIGGLLILAAAGPGGLSLDERKKA